MSISFGFPIITFCLCSINCGTCKVKGRIYSGFGYNNCSICSLPQGIPYDEWGD